MTECPRATVTCHHLLVEREVLPFDPNYLAPDGSEVRLLVAGTKGNMAHFRLAPGEVSVAKQHASVEELWYFTSGRGEMCIGDETTVVCAGVSVRVPPLTRFQFRSIGRDALEAVAVAMPPWPGADEELDAEARW
jgi:mannose-6-phosphate isomerase-like protein (cupin superfamily)